MWIETQRLIIRDVEIDDKAPFVMMAEDGSLNECGFDKDCSSWITEWFTEAKKFIDRDNPYIDYLPYTITLKDETMVMQLKQLKRIQSIFSTIIMPIE